MPDGRMAERARLCIIAAVMLVAVAMFVAGLGSGVSDALFDRGTGLWLAAGSVPVMAIGIALIVFWRDRDPDT